MIQNSSRSRVLELVPSSDGEDPSVDPLLDYDKVKARVVVRREDGAKPLVAVRDLGWALSVSGNVPGTKITNL